MKKYILGSFLLLIGTISLIFSLSLQDAPTSNTLSQKATEVMASVIEINPDPLTSIPPISNNLVRSMAHVGLFFILGCISLLTCTLCHMGYKKSLFFTLLLGMLTAFCDELIQLSSAGRAFEWSDLGKDLFGIICSLILFSILYLFVQSLHLLNTKES